MLPGVDYSLAFEARHARGVCSPLATDVVGLVVEAVLRRLTLAGIPDGSSEWLRG